MSGHTVGAALDRALGAGIAALDQGNSGSLLTID